MKLMLYQIDAFANRPFEGNPAAICPLDSWLPDELMQSIAAENNLSETAFFIPTDKGYHIRWFTPMNEVDLCGHATLASAYVIFNLLDYKNNEIVFESRSGLLRVNRNSDWLKLDFPAQAPTSCKIPELIVKAFNSQPIECLRSEDYIVVLSDEQSVLNAKPDFSLLEKLDLRGVAITAKGTRYDFVSRFFAPKYGINEDPVTGSAYTQLVPYWSDQLGVYNFHSKQVSIRGGEVYCELAGERVLISGKAVMYMKGEIEL
ncbi:MAG: PhzF family phenazine biosynthesis isomerase [Gammaproteobacteria bacterium]|nr:PhzF family phenazine biosynthesis isomerase [Gammaproteobacteria bacterium]